MTKEAKQNKKIIKSVSFNINKQIISTYNNKEYDRTTILTKFEELINIELLYEENNITYDEFQELRKVDDDYRREIMLDQAESLQTAVDAIGADLQTIISLLLNTSSTGKGGMIAYHHLIINLLKIADFGLSDLINSSTICMSISLVSFTLSSIS